MYDDRLERVRESNQTVREKNAKTLSATSVDEGPKSYWGSRQLKGDDGDRKKLFCNRQFRRTGSERSSLYIREHERQLFCRDQSSSGIGDYLKELHTSDVRHGLSHSTWMDEPHSIYHLQPCSARHFFVYFSSYQEISSILCHLTAKCASRNDLAGGDVLVP